MSKPPPEEKKGFWEIAETRIGVVSAALGLVVLVLGFPRAAGDVFSRSDTKASEGTLERQRAELAAKGPRIEVSYVFQTRNVLGGWEPFDAERRGAADAAESVTSSPVVRNEILEEVNSERDPAAGGCGVGVQPDLSLVFLVVSNHGRRDATDIKVQVRRLRLSGPVRVRESAAGRDDYIAKLRERTHSSGAVTVRLPQTLGPGKSVRLPLFVSAARRERYDTWCVVSSVALEPRSVSIVDPVLGTPSAARVRRMVDPVQIERGVIARG